VWLCAAAAHPAGSDEVFDTVGARKINFCLTLNGKFTSTNFTTFMSHNTICHAWVTCCDLQAVWSWGEAGRRIRTYWRPGDEMDVGGCPFRGALPALVKMSVDVFFLP
jgi:hypothetical protein